MTFEELWRPLKQVYDEGEARAVGRWLLEVGFQLQMADLLGGALDRLSSEEERRLLAMQHQLLDGVPVQYVTGLADFGPRQFEVTSGVLIPRPETYELCQWIIEERQAQQSQQRILDIGTGSGCIACTLAAELPLASLTAWDLSEEALRIARRNAVRHHVTIDFQQRDALKVASAGEGDEWDVIVSNPPYICRKEAVDMASQVLDYEPTMALFVPDDDPLLFYRAISHYALSTLRREGRLYFEINPCYANELKAMLFTLAFKDVELREDAYGKERMVRAIL